MILVESSVTGAYAQAFGDSPLKVRVRSVHLDSSSKDSTPLGLSINNKTFGEGDVIYFLSPNLASERVLTTPQKQTVHPRKRS